MATLHLFGEIGAEITADRTANFLGALPSREPLDILLNSAGGSLQEATAIFNLLRTHDGPVTVEITGWALSAGSLIAMAGSTVRMHDNALLMIHAPWVMSGGNSRDLRDTADMLDIAKNSMVQAYTRRGIPRATVEKWLSGEQDYWFTSDEAKAVGLIDETISATEPVSIKNCPFTIPQNILDKVMEKQPKPSFMAAIGERVNAAINPTYRAEQEALRAEEQRRAEAVLAEAQRREDVKAKFRKFANREGVSAVMDACLDDIHCSPQDAGHRLLAHLGKDCEPVMGNYVPHETNYNGHYGAFGMPTQDQRIENFKAMAADAILMRAGFQVSEPHPAANDLRGKSIVAIAENMLSLLGKKVYGFGPSAIIRAAQSTSDFPNLLGVITGRALRQGYVLAPATHALWTGERDVADFRPQTLIQLSEAPGLEKVNEGGEYTSSYFSESAESFSVETFGRIVSLTRQALINDDLSAFTRIPAAFGASARRKEADLVYGKLAGSSKMSDGKTLFHADHGNLAAAGSALTCANLGAARAAMRKQKGIKGLDYIDPTPHFLIVPVAIETCAEELLSSLVNPARSNDTSNPDWIRGLTLVADPRLDAVSATAWYLAAHPSQIDTIVRAYLAGEQRPYVEENEEFVRDVTSFKTRLDVGVGVIDWRGMFKNPGA